MCADSDKNSDEAKLQKAKELIGKLPGANQGLVQYLCQFLHKVRAALSIARSVLTCHCSRAGWLQVSTFEKSNKMSPANLAIVFAPNILKNRNETVQSVVYENKS